MAVIHVEEEARAWLQEAFIWSAHSLTWLWNCTLTKVKTYDSWKRCLALEIQANSKEERLRVLSHKYQGAEL